MKKATTFILLLASTFAWANECELVVNSTDQMRFDKTEMSAPASCEEVTVTLNHTGQLAANVMGHNWVLTKTADFQAVATAGMSAGLDNQYVPPGDARVLAYSKVIGGGESTSVTFSTKGLSKDGEYTFFCSFPGHWAIMKGTFKLI
ncbi:azurin [Marinicella sp. S1101]|uniref:azurin n=1 Tax=Marinicella marina TaxID=2996016 RepID=UPI002260DADB|nr:azurin [Marinicella marina]MCX7553471.1 azurin [Marinicella marina]MDJ1140095.1 azurin [Marinicella marina]